MLRGRYPFIICIPWERCRFLWIDESRSIAQNVRNKKQEVPTYERSEVLPYQERIEPA